MPLRSPARLFALAAALLVVGAATAWLLAGDEIEGAAKRAEVAIDGALSDPPVRLPQGSFVSSGSRRRAEVWAVGDGADYDLAGAEVTRLIKRGRPDRVLYLGDVYETGTAEEFARNYVPTYGKLAKITAPSLGNHEAANTIEGYERYWQEVRGTPPPSFYSFELAGWEILSLNSEIDYGPDSAQVRWLDQETRDGGDCRLAFWHRPRYSAGTIHGDDASLQSLWDALSGRARLIVNAHDHDMQRLEPRQGMIELIAGAGGSSLYPIDPSYPGLRFGDDRHQGALRLRLRPGRASYAFVSVQGETLDSGSLRCQRG